MTPVVKPVVKDAEHIELGARIRSGLASLRRRARLALGLYGLSSLAVYSLALTLISFGLDRSLRLAWGTRATALVIALTVLLTVVWRRLVRPLQVRLTDVELARRVEAWNPALCWRLLSAVQFADPSWQPGPETSRELAAQIVRDADRLAADVSFVAPVPLAPVSRAVFRGGVVLLAGLALVSSFPEGARTWFQRNVLLSASVSWPRDTRLELVELAANAVPVTPTREDGQVVYTVARGATLSFVVRAGGVVPARVYLDSKPTSGDSEREVLALDALEGGRFRTTVERVAAGFVFSLEGGDGEIGPFRVDVLHRPWIESLILEIEPPAYTGIRSRSFPLESSSVSLPVGTKVRLRAEVSKPLALASLRELKIGETDDEEVAAIHTGAVVSDPYHGFSAAFVVQRSSILGVELEDLNGLTLERPTRFTVVATPDRAPTVRLRLSGVGLNVTPQASVGFAVSAEDEYGVASWSLRYLAKVGPEKDPISGARELKRELGPGEDEVLELEGLGLAPKMALTLWGEGVDTDPRGPNVGRSPALQLRVVTPEELLNELLRRIHEQRLELERMITQEEQLAQGLLGGDQTTLDRAAGAQRDVGRTVGRAGEAVHGVVRELVSNKLLDKAIRARLREQVADPLLLLEEGPLTSAAELAEAALETEGAKQVLTMGLAGEAAKSVARELRVIVDRMGRLEELAELVSLLKRVIANQRKLMDETRKKKQ